MRSLIPFGNYSTIGKIIFIAISFEKLYKALNELKKILLQEMQKQEKKFKNTDLISKLNNAFPTSTKIIITPTCHHIVRICLMCISFATFYYFFLNG